MGKKYNGKGVSSRFETSEDLFSATSIAKTTSTSFDINKIKIKPLKCKNAKQKELLNLINEKEITIVRGPAGCGKSYIQTHCALSLLLDSTTPYNKIFIVTPPEPIEIGRAHV
jgi:phosphate starvation-inducible protein PhoH